MKRLTLNERQISRRIRKKHHQMILDAVMRFEGRTMCPETMEGLIAVLTPMHANFTRAYLALGSKRERK